MPHVPDCAAGEGGHDQQRCARGGGQDAAPAPEAEVAPARVGVWFAAVEMASQSIKGCGQAYWYCIRSMIQGPGLQIIRTSGKDRWRPGGAARPSAS